MIFSIPRELTDPTIRTSLNIPHADGWTFDALANEIDRRRELWLKDHPGWSYQGSDIVKCADGSGPPAYDVNLEFSRPRTPAEQEIQDRDREAYLAQKELDYQRREKKQEELLDEVLKSLGI